MNEKKKRKLKKFYFHPITTFIFLSLLLIVLSQILSAFQMQATYNTINENTNTLDPILIAVEGLFSFKEIKYILSNSLTNFLSFAPLGTLTSGIPFFGWQNAEYTFRPYLPLIPLSYICALSEAEAQEIQCCIYPPL